MSVWRLPPAPQQPTKGLVSLLGPAAGTAVLSGTVTTATEADIVAGGKTIILTLTGDTWVAAGATFDVERQNIINGIDSAQAEATGWDAVVKATQGVAGVVRTSSTVVTITLSAFATFNITADETITATIPSTALVSGVPIIATPTFSVTFIEVVGLEAVEPNIDMFFAWTAYAAMVNSVYTTAHEQIEQDTRLPISAKAVTGTISGSSVVSATTAVAGTNYDFDHQTIIAWQIPPPEIVFALHIQVAVEKSEELRPISSRPITSSISGTTTVAGTISKAGTNFDSVLDLEASYLAPNLSASTAIDTANTDNEVDIKDGAVVENVLEDEYLTQLFTIDLPFPIFEEIALPVSSKPITGSANGTTTASGTLTKAGTNFDSVLDLEASYLSPNLLSAAIETAIADTEQIPTDYTVPVEGFLLDVGDDVFVGYSAYEAATSSAYSTAHEQTEQDYRPVGAKAVSGTVSGSSSVSGTVTVAGTNFDFDEQTTIAWQIPSLDFPPALHVALLQNSEIAISSKPITGTVNGSATVTGTLTVAGTNFDTILDLEASYIAPNTSASVAIDTANFDNEVDIEETVSPQVVGGDLTIHVVLGVSAQYIAIDAAQADNESIPVDGTVAQVADYPFDEDYVPTYGADWLADAVINAAENDNQGIVATFVDDIVEDDYLSQLTVADIPAIVFEELTLPVSSRPIMGSTNGTTTVSGTLSKAGTSFEVQPAQVELLTEDISYVPFIAQSADLSEIIPVSARPITGSVSATATVAGTLSKAGTAFESSTEYIQLDSIVDIFYVPNAEETPVGSKAISGSVSASATVTGALSKAGTTFEVTPSEAEFQVLDTSATPYLAQFAVEQSAYGPISAKPITGTISTSATVAGTPSVAGTNFDSSSELIPAFLMPDMVADGAVEEAKNDNELIPVDGAISVTDYLADDDSSQASFFVPDTQVFVVDEPILPVSSQPISGSTTGTSTVVGTLSKAGTAFQDLPLETELIVSDISFVPRVAQEAADQSFAQPTSARPITGSINASSVVTGTLSKAGTNFDVSIELEAAYLAPDMSAMVAIAMVDIIDSDIPINYGDQVFEDDSFDSQHYVAPLPHIVGEDPEIPVSSKPISGSVSATATVAATLSKAGTNFHDIPADAELLVVDHSADSYIVEFAAEQSAYNPISAKAITGTISGSATVTGTLSKAGTSFEVIVSEAEFVTLDLSALPYIVEFSAEQSAYIPDSSKLISGTITSTSTVVGTLSKAGTNFHDLPADAELLTVDISAVPYTASYAAEQSFAQPVSARPITGSISATATVSGTLSKAGTAFEVLPADVELLELDRSGNYSAIETSSFHELLPVSSKPITGSVTAAATVVGTLSKAGTNFDVVIELEAAYIAPDLSADTAIAAAELTNTDIPVDGGPIDYGTQVPEDDSFESQYYVAPPPHIVAEEPIIPVSAKPISGSVSASASVAGTLSKSGTSFSDIPFAEEIYGEDRVSGYYIAQDASNQSFAQPTGQKAITGTVSGSATVVGTLSKAGTNFHDLPAEIELLTIDLSGVSAIAQTSADQSFAQPVSAKAITGTVAGTTVVAGTLSVAGTNFDTTSELTAGYLFTELFPYTTIESAENANSSVPVDADSVIEDSVDASLLLAAKDFYVSEDVIYPVSAVAISPSSATGQSVVAGTLSKAGTNFDTVVELEAAYIAPDTSAISTISMAEIGNTDIPVDGSIVIVDYVLEDDSFYPQFFVMPPPTILGEDPEISVGAKPITGSVSGTTTVSGTLTKAGTNFHDLPADAELLTVDLSAVPYIQQFAAEQSAYIPVSAKSVAGSANGVCTVSGTLSKAGTNFDASAELIPAFIPIDYSMVSAEAQDSAEQSFAQPVSVKTISGTISASCSVVGTLSEAGTGFVDAPVELEIYGPDLVTGNYQAQEAADQSFAQPISGTAITGTASGICTVSGTLSVAGTAFEVAPSPAEFIAANLNRHYATVQAADTEFSGDGKPAVSGAVTCVATVTGTLSVAGTINESVGESDAFFIQPYIDIFTADYATQITLAIEYAVIPAVVFDGSYITNVTYNGSFVPILTYNGQYVYTIYRRGNYIVLLDINGSYIETILIR